MNMLHKYLTKIFNLLNNMKFNNNIISMIIQCDNTTLGVFQKAQRQVRLKK